MNWNLFERMRKLELDNLHLNVMLKSARVEIDTLKKITKEQTQWLSALQSTKEGVTPEKKRITPEKRRITPEKKREYARRYYAKKKADREAAARVAAGVAA